MEELSIIEGDLQARDLKFTIVAARFNDFVVERLIDGAVDALRQHGAEPASLELVRVPGAFDLPLVVRKIAESGRSDAIIALGAVIRGDTPHFDYVCDAVTRGLGHAVAAHKVPIGFGVLTTDNVQQAMDRAGAKDANKGYEALLVAVEMVNVLRQVS